MMRLGKPGSMRWGGGKKEGDGNNGRQSRRNNASGSSGGSTGSSGSGSGNGSGSAGKDCKNSSTGHHQASPIASLAGNKKPLWKGIEKGDWDAVRTTLRTKRGQVEAAKVAFTGQSVLSKTLQCHKGELPLDIVQLLMAAAPKALSEVDLWGQLPLHVACKEGVSYEVFTAVLQTGSPLATITRCGEGRTPLHYAVRQTCSLSDTLSAENALPTCGSSSDVKRRRSGLSSPQDGQKTDDSPCDMDGVTYTGGAASTEEGERIMQEMIDVIVSLAFCSPRAILMEDKSGETPWDVVLMWIDNKVEENNGAPLHGHCVVLQDQLRRIMRHAIAWNTLEGEFDEGSDEEMMDSSKQKASQSAAKKAKSKSVTLEASGGVTENMNAAPTGTASQHGNPSQSQGRISVPWRPRAGAATVEEPNDDDDHTEVMSEDSNERDSNFPQR